MKTMTFTTMQFCQVENAWKRVSFAFMRKIGRGLQYLFSPEDSRDTVYHEDGNRAVSAHLAQLKTGLWILIAISVSALIAQLQ